MSTRYIHLRRRHPFFGHLESTGGVTVAYDVDPDGTVRYAWSQCHMKEHYFKKRGRGISSSRLSKGEWTERGGKHYTVRTFQRVEGVNIVEQILTHHDSASKE
jgi:hypothetical protein